MTIDTLQSLAIIALGIAVATFIGAAVAKKQG